MVPQVCGGGGDASDGEDVTTDAHVLSRCLGGLMYASLRPKHHIRDDPGHTQWQPSQEVPFDTGGR